MRGGSGTGAVVRGRPALGGGASTAVAWTALLALAAVGAIVASQRLLSVVAGTDAALFPAPESFEEPYRSHPGLALLHVVPGLAFVVLGPFQLAGRLRRRHLSLHRWSGRLFLLASASIAVTALVLAFLRPFGGPAETSATVVFTLVFAYSLGRAFLHVRRGEVGAHREWMIRGFAVGLGVATIRPVAGVGMAVTGLALADVLGGAFWIAFSLHLLAAEAWIRGTRETGGPRFVSSSGGGSRRG